MNFGSMKEVLLTRAKDIFLFNCRVAGLDSQSVSAYRDVLCSFVHFTGDMLVKELTASHVRGTSLHLMIHCLSRPLFDYHQIMVTPHFSRSLLAPKTKHLYNCTLRLRHKPWWFSCRSWDSSTKSHARYAAMKMFFWQI